MATSKKSICAIILAAGESKRFGPQNKLLAEVDGVPILERVVRAISSCEPVGKTVVVTGKDHDAVASLLSGYGVQLIQNLHWAEGMGRSLAEGVKAADAKSCFGILVCLGDLPFLENRSVRLVIDQFRALDGSKIVQPVYTDRVGHPVIFPAGYCEQLSRLSGDQGARSVIRDNDRVLIPVKSSGIYEDIDTLDGIGPT